MRIPDLAMLAIVLAAALPAAARAAATVTYKYDAKGRLTEVRHAGGQADGVISAYTFDAADNRTRQTISGARPMVVVAPLGGLTPIILSNPGE